MGMKNPQDGQPVVQTTPIPYNNSSILADHAYKQAIAALQNQKRETVGDFGFTLNKKGVVRMDANNTYGQMQQMYRQQGQELTDLGNAQQGAGLLGYGGGGTGLAAQQRAMALNAQGAETSQLLKDFQGRMAAIRLGKIQAKEAKGNDEYSGTLQAIMNAITAGAFTPAAPVR
jgi:hypothetical protein